MCQTAAPTMASFAQYEPDARGEPLDGVLIRDGDIRDVHRVAEIYSEREGDSTARVEPFVAKEFETHAPAWKERYVCVAVIHGRVEAYGRAGYLRMTERAGVEGMPDGWYLSGLVVDSAFRRRGIGRQLVEHRLRRLAAVTDQVRYFVSDENRPSIRLHQDLGFIEERRRVSFPRTDFDPRGGTLFLLNLPKR